MERFHIDTEMDTETERAWWAGEIHYCRYCQQFFPATTDYFAIDRRSPNKLTEICHACRPGMARRHGRIAAQRRQERIRQFPNEFNEKHRAFALEYFGNACAYCEARFDELQPGNFATFDHYIPLYFPFCPGTVQWNMVPACWACNSTKRNSLPKPWLESYCRPPGPRTAREIIAKIETYFAIVRERAQS